MLKKMNLERYVLIAEAVALADYLENPECFEDLVLLCATHSMSTKLAPNADASLGTINATVGGRDSPDKGSSASQGTSLLDRD